MFLAALVLVSINCEHDSLEQGVDLGHGHQAAEMRNVSRLRLEEEEQVAVLLCLVVVGEEALLKIEAFFKVTGDLVLLREQLR
jgi:hypothetical protein